MADMADNLVTLIDTKWSGPAKPDFIEKVLVRPDIAKLQDKDYVIIYPLGSGRHIHVTRDYYNTVYGFEILCFTPTSSDRLKELYEEVIDIIYNWYLTGINEQRVMDQKDLSSKKTGKFKYTIHIELEALMVYKGTPVSSGIPAGEGTYTATALRAESDEEIDIMDNSKNVRLKFEIMDDPTNFILTPVSDAKGSFGKTNYYIRHGFFTYGHIHLQLLPKSDNTGIVGHASYAFEYMWAYDFFDKTKAFDLQTSIDIINSFDKKPDEEKMDIEKLHEKVKGEHDEIIFDENGEPITTGKKVFGRNIGACVSALMAVVKEQQKQIDDLIKQLGVE